MPKAIPLFFISIILCACATTSTVDKDSQFAGISRIFNADYERVKAATLASIQSLNVNITSTGDYQGGFKILFSKPMSVWSWGEVGRVNVQFISDNESAVQVVAEKRSRFQVTGTDEESFAREIFAGIDEVLSR